MAPQEPSEPIPKLKASDLTGLKFFRKVRPMLDCLHDIGTERDRAGNRKLHYDQYGVLVLMWLFNPILTSMRGLQHASNLKDIQKKFGVGRASLGSLSESVTIFDPEPLKRIAEQLATQVPSADPSRFAVIGKQLTAFDGSVLPPKILLHRELTEADRAAGVRVDREVVMGQSSSNTKTVPTDHLVRYLEIEVPLHVRTGSKGSNCVSLLSCSLG